MNRGGEPSPRPSPTFALLRREREEEMDGSWRGMMSGDRTHEEAVHRGARKGAGGPHPGLLPWGEGEHAPRVSRGRAGPCSPRHHGSKDKCHHEGHEGSTGTIFSRIRYMDVGFDPILCPIFVAFVRFVVSYPGFRAGRWLPRVATAGKVERGVVHRRNRHPEGRKNGSPWREPWVVVQNR